MHIKMGTTVSPSGGGLRVLTGFGREVHGQRGDGVVGWVVVELRHQQVVVLHPQGELLHV